ncbi:DUF6891 domain-containing protein [Streptomyces sp. NPDC008001]|uniref:DUF6891 domain-containing protein n=1 Tax=Streptomyces sp. NPDC008001 TaxID=3364804 RepID=UPI0036E48423
MLPITVNTEPGEVRSHVTADELAEIIARLGGEGDRFAVVERAEDAEDAAGAQDMEAAENAEDAEDGGDHYIQTWHEGDGPYEVEYRDGTAERHFGVRMEGPAEVTAVFLAWARGEEGWADGHAWERVRFPSPGEGEDGEEDAGPTLDAAPDPAPEAATDPEPGAGLDAGLDAGLLAEAEAQARRMIRCGFDTAEEIAEAVSDYFHADGGTPLSVPAARRIVRRLWRERLAEQESWPEVTDADRVAAAFAALNGSGVTARMHFACCGNCASAEIGGEAAEGDHGFVFFQYADTQHAAEAGSLLLTYGAHGTAPGDEATAAVGREVAAALVAAGLTVRWDGDPDRAIRVEPLDWRRRLPAA